MNNGFNSKVILITGAASGFGKLLAQKLALQGARLVLADINEAGVQAVAENLSAETVALKCDVSKERDVKALVDAAVSHFGQLDIAVNNAGIAPPSMPLIDIDEEQFDLNISVNAKSVFFGMKHQIRQMLNQGGGVILNTASMAGLVADTNIADYVAAKHAVVGLTKAATTEYAAQNIRVNAICPYYCPTPMVTEGIDEEEQKILAARIPAQRLPTPEEIVDMMLLMISDKNTYMNGHCVAMDGGMSAASS